MGDKVKIVKLDVDTNNATAGKYNIVSIPSLLFFKGGEAKGARRATIASPL